MTGSSGPPHPGPACTTVHVRVGGQAKIKQRACLVAGVRLNPQTHPNPNRKCPHVTGLIDVWVLTVFHKHTHTHTEQSHTPVWWLLLSITGRTYLKNKAVVCRGSAGSIVH